MKIETEEQYEELLLFVDAFFEDPDNFTVEDGRKVKEVLAAMKEYEDAHPDRLKNQ